MNNYKKLVSSDFFLSQRSLRSFIKASQKSNVYRCTSGTSGVSMRSITTLRFLVESPVCWRLCGVFSFPAAEEPPPAVDVCADRHQRLTAVGKAASRVPHRLFYHALYQIGAVSHFSASALHTPSELNNHSPSANAEGNMYCCSYESSPHKVHKPGKTKTVWMEFKTFILMKH